MSEKVGRVARAIVAATGRDPDDLVTGIRLDANGLIVTEPGVFNSWQIETFVLEARAAIAAVRDLPKPPSWGMDEQAWWDEIFDEALK